MADEFAPLEDDELSDFLGVDDDIDDDNDSRDIGDGYRTSAANKNMIAPPYNDSNAQGNQPQVQTNNEGVIDFESHPSEEFSADERVPPLYTDDSTVSAKHPPEKSSNENQTKNNKATPGSAVTEPTTESHSKEDAKHNSEDKEEDQEYSKSFADELPPGHKGDDLLQNDMLKVVYCAPDAYSVSHISDIDTANQSLSSVHSVHTSGNEQESSPSSHRRKAAGKRLRFDTLGLFGREREQQVLRDCLGNISHTKQVVFLKGTAGVGKTALANSLQDSVKEIGGSFVCGKFDPYHRNKPYSGIVQACQQICGEMVTLRNQGGEEKHQSISLELLNKIGSEIHVLRSIIPGLAEAIDDSTWSEDEENKLQSQENKVRIFYSFRLFFREVARLFHPLVIVLDDLQNADESSIELMKALILDRFNETNIMFVGIYRSDEIEKDDALHRAIAQLEEETTAPSQEFVVAHLTIGELDVTLVHQLLNYLMDGKKHDNVRRLAVLCAKRTAGNLLYLVTFLRLLESKRLLVFDPRHGRWIWDKESILNGTQATDNVVELIQKDMMDLPESVRLRLVVASCLGHSFEKATFDVVWDKLSSKLPHLQDDTIEEHSLWLDGKFLELCDAYDQSYQWIHDRIQEAALSLIEKEELSRMKAQIGNTLLSHSLEKRTIVVAASLLNDGQRPTDNSARIEMAEINLRASEYAASVSSFSSAADFANKGILNLPPDHWKSHTKLSLGLYASAVEAEACLGRINDMHEKANIVLEQDIPLYNKLRVYNAKIDNTRLRQEAADLIMQILEDLYCKFPKGKAARVFSMFREIFRMRSRIKAMTVRDIAKLPIVDDSVQIEVMKLLDKLFIISYVTEDKAVMMLALLRSVSLTLERGLCEGSAPALACMGMVIIIALKDYDAASKCCQLAVHMMTRVRHKNGNGRALHYLAGFVQCWSQNVNTLGARLLKAREMCLSSGDHTNTAISIYNYIALGLQSGRPLDQLEDECRCYAPQLVDWGKIFLYKQTLCYWRYIRVLQGIPEDSPQDLTDVEEALQQTTSEVEDRKIKAIETSLKIRLCSILGEHDIAASLAIQTANGYMKAAPAHASVMADTFWKGVAYFAMARTTGKRIYKNAAGKILSLTQSWAANDNPNVHHHLSLLSAEQSVLKGDHKSSQAFYQRAISQALDGGFIQDAAYVNERYGEYLLRERNDKEQASSKLAEAIRLFDEWGAKKKVQMIREEHWHLWPQPQTISFPNEDGERLDDSSVA